MSPFRFEERYCEQHNLTLEEYPRHLRNRAFYPHARFIAPILTLFNGDYLAADNDFIQDVGQLTRFNEFFSSSFEYIHHPANRGFLRRYCRIRISTERMRRIVRRTLKAQAAVATQKTMMPFPTESGETPKAAKSSPKNPA